MLLSMSVNHRDGGEELPEFGVGEPHQILSCFKISSTRLLALITMQ